MKFKLNKATRDAIARSVRRSEIEEAAMAAGTQGTTMDDLLERLEHAAAGGMNKRSLAKEAAEEIKRLRAEVERLRQFEPAPNPDGHD